MLTVIVVIKIISYHKGQGWVGAVEFFVNKSIGACSYSENNVKLSHGSVIIAKEDARNDVNDKTTTVNIVGTEDSGFLYSINWYDSTFFRELKCSNKHYSEGIKQQVIDLANQIDLKS